MITTRGSRHRPGGYAHWSNGGLGAKDIERDTVTCFHCNDAYYVQPFQSGADAGGFCRICMKLICGRCADLGICHPFELKLQAMEQLDIAIHRRLGLPR